MTSSPTPTPTPTPPRLEGDALYEWAQTIAVIRSLAERKQQLAVRLLEQMGYTPGPYLLSDDGYVVSQQEVERALRVRSIGGSPEERAEPD
jgi:hypothetical protein